nr:MAG TPA: hypothetical protein [Caudoviricetes sp.]
MRCCVGSKIFSSNKNLEKVDHFSISPPVGNRNPKKTFLVGGVQSSNFPWLQGRKKTVALNFDEYKTILKNRFGFSNCLSFIR